MITYAEQLKYCRADARELGLVFRKADFYLNGRLAWGFYDKESGKEIYTNTLLKCFHLAYSGDLLRVLDA